MKPPPRPRPANRPAPQPEPSVRQTSGQQRVPQSEKPSGQQPGPQNVQPQPAQPAPPRRRISSRAVPQDPVPDTQTAPRAVVTPPAPPAAPRTGTGAVATGQRAGSLGTPRVSVLSTGLTDRLAERRLIARNLRTKKVAGVLGLVVAAAVLLWVVLGSPFLQLKEAEVTVNGTGALVSEQDVLGAVSPFIGTPLARLDMAKVHDSVAKIANVREVVQTRRWPNGLTITVAERVPVAAVPEGKEFALLDNEAVIVTRIKEAPPELPVIQIPLNDARERTLKSALSILEQLPPDLLAQVASISADTQDSVTLKLRTGLVVHWGSADETPLKLEVLTVLLKSAEKEGMKVIDLSAPTFPITR